MSMVAPQRPNPYMVDGVPVPSVTTILRWAGIHNLEDVQPHVLQRAADRGTDVHLLCHDIDCGFDPWWEGTEYEGFAVAYYLFKSEFGFQPIHTEEAMVHPVYLYGGRPDYIGQCAQWRERQLTKPMVVLDLKTGMKEMKYWSLQTAGYLGLAQIQEPDMKNTITRLVVQLRKDGSYRTYEFTDHARALQVFYGLVAAYHYAPVVT